MLFRSMHNVGLNVAINSDDAEMARRLNQEAAKSVMYGGMSEVDAFNMVTINVAKMLHVDKQVGSIKKGKEADLVLWSDNPLSVYAKPIKTFVDGVEYYDIEKDAAMRKEIFAERNRIIQQPMPMLTTTSYFFQRCFCRSSSTTAIFFV